MLWQKSPQYESMPHDQYMRTDEGKRAQQAFTNYGTWAKELVPSAAPAGAPRPTPSQGGIPQDAPFSAASQLTKAPDMSAYAPGRAQPTQTQSQGTPYGQPAQQPANPYANMEPGVYQNGQRIPGDMTTAINTAMQRNAATAHLYNQAQAPYSFFGNAMGMDLGAPQNDPQAMFRQAQEMVNAGWQNPLQRYFDEADTAQSLAQQAPPTMYQPTAPPPAGIPFGNDSLPPPVRRGQGTGGTPPAPNFAPVPARTPDGFQGWESRSRSPFQPAILLDGSATQQAAPGPGLTRAASPSRQPSPPSRPVGLPGYYNDKGERFKMTASFAPETPVEYQSRMYADWARNAGYTNYVPPPSRSPFAN